MQALLPRGRAWPRDSDATQTAVITGLCGLYAGSNASAAELLVEAFPSTANEMLPEWEQTLNLSATGPDVAGYFNVDSNVSLALRTSTTTLSFTLSQRQANVVAALIDTGGQSRAYFIQMAAALGVTVTISVFSRFTVRCPIGTPINGDAWAYTWQVNAPVAAAIGYTPTFDIVLSPGNLGNPTLDQRLAATKPAHTVCIASYT